MFLSLEELFRNSENLKTHAFPEIYLRLKKFKVRSGKENGIINQVNFIYLLGKVLSKLGVWQMVLSLSLFYNFFFFIR